MKRLATLSTIFAMLALGAPLAMSSAPAGASTNSGKFCSAAEHSLAVMEPVTNTLSAILNGAFGSIGSSSTTLSASQLKTDRTKAISQTKTLIVHLSTYAASLPPVVALAPSGVLREAFSWDATYAKDAVTLEKAALARYEALPTSPTSTEYTASVTAGAPGLEALSGSVSGFIKYKTATTALKTACPALAGSS